MTPEFSRPVRLDTLGPSPREVTVEADEAERAALARRFGLVELGHLAATAAIRREGATVSVEGHLTAAVTQACVVTGDDVAAELTEPFALRFEPAGAVEDEEVELDAAALDTLSYEGGSIDLGEAVAETLSLALPPFPRAPHAGDALRAAGVADEGAAGPFAGLAALKGKLG